MARYGQRPENALKRAHEFIEVGKPARALDTLSEVFRNKKWAYTWSENVLEPIMFKYLELCVELRRSHIAKEGLFQYRNMFQSVNVNSLENVIRFYLRTAEERTDSARSQSHQAVIDIGIDDLDNLATPESILLSAVSGDGAQDRSDRTILTPWVKFLWESYCQCLELLRTNVHVENLYHDIARMAFQFCLKYVRKTEFRKLCDKLRKHLEDICKLTPQVANVSISKPETQQLNLETRLFQLDSAIQMELWQEAYKAIEDIHGLMNMSKKSPVPKTMANYYQKLALVFWKAGNYLFHAAALFKLFQLSREMKKNMSPEELQKMACRVLLATLSIPLPSAHPEFDRFIETDKSPLEKAQRLATLLGLSQPPTRQSLIKDLVRFNVVNLASNQLQDLYLWLEVEFNPLQLCERVETVIESLVADQYLTQYIRALTDLTLVRLIQQVAQVYQTIEMARMLELAKFADSFHLERLLVDCVRHNDMQIRIDHGGKCIRFGMDLAEAQREDKQEGPTLQIMPSEQIRNQLVTMMTVLHRAANIINPNKKKFEREKLRTKMVQLYHDTKILEHQRILQRHKIIEDRKEYIERKNNQREEEELRRQEQVQRQQMMAEHKRLEAEREERERRRHENEIQQIKDRHLKEKMQQISQTAHGQKILKKLDDEEIKKLDAEQIAAKEAEELQKERREMQQKLKTQEKRVDYFERAKRIEEIPLLEKMFEEKHIQDRLFWEEQEKERIENLIKEREIAVTTSERLVVMKADKDAFSDKLINERRSIYLEKLRVWEKLMEEERKKRLAERRLKRKEERRQQFVREKEEEAERKRIEEERKVQEELRRQKEEEEERRERERKAREEEQSRKEKEAREKQLRLQREREEEAERKLDGWRDKPEGRPRDADDLRNKDRDREESSSAWRRGGREEPPKSDSAWRPSVARTRDGESKPEDTWRSARASADDRSERDRGTDRSERDRGFSDRDRGLNDRDRGLNDRDRGFNDRDRGFNDRDRGFSDRDRGGFRDRDRDRGGGFGDRDRAPVSGGTSWRRADPLPDRSKDEDRAPRGDRDDDRRRGDERRGPPREDDDRRRDDGRRDERRGPPRDGEDRRKDDGRRDERRGPPRDDDDRMPRRDRDDDRRRDDGRRDERRGPPRDDDDRRRDELRRDDRRGPPRDDEDRIRRDRDDDRRRDDGKRDVERDRRGPPRDDRGPREEKNDWRSAPASRGKEPVKAAPPPAREPRPPKPAREEGDDEWTTVSSRR